MISYLKNKQFHRGSLPIVIAIFVMALILIASGVTAAAVWGDRTGVQNSAGNATGGMCSSVPAKYQTIFSGATSGDIPSALIAAVFSIEHGSAESYTAGYTPTSAKNDAWPESNGDPNAITIWQTSSAGAQGPMQFTSGTWSQYGSGGNVQNITDAAAGTARMMQANFTSNSGTTEEKLKKAISRYNPGAGAWNSSWYVDKVWANYIIFNCGGNGGSIVEVAQSQIGVAESGGKDCGVGQYTGGTCEPWCADFVSWVYNQAGYKMKRIAGADELYHWFTVNQIGFVRGSATPQPGDIISFNYSHVGIVEFVKGDTVHTIEGNTSTENVARRTHQINDSDIVGYGRWKQ